MRPIKNSFLSVLIFAIFVPFFVLSCKKDKDSGTANTRAIKYEITGTFSGKLDIVYSDNINGNTTLANVAIPWTKEIEYGSNVTGIGIGSQGSSAGVAGQTATLKIYSNGTVVRTSTATVSATGGIVLPTIAYTF